MPRANATSPSAAAAGDGKRAKRAKRGEMGAPASFLDKLCDILSEPRLSEHIAWNEVCLAVQVSPPNPLVFPAISHVRAWADALLIVSKSAVADVIS